MLWKVEYLDRRDDEGIHVKMVEAESFNHAWKTLESDDICCIKSCTSLEVSELIREIDEMIG